MGAGIQVLASDTLMKNIEEEEKPLTKIHKSEGTTPTEKLLSQLCREHILKILELSEPV